MKMNKMYEAPKAEMVELNVNKSFMEDNNDATWNGGSWDEETWS